MKFSKLKEQFSALKKKYNGKKNIEAEDLKQLGAMLSDRRKGYQKTLSSDLGDKKKKQIKVKIKVIDAQIKKVAALLKN